VTGNLVTGNLVMGKPPFEAIVTQHGPMVLRVCRAVLGWADADDAWSETFLSALRAYPDLPADANVEAWLVTIAHRKAIDLARARGRRAIPVAEAAEFADAAPAAAGAGLAGTGLSGAETADADALPDEQLWTLVAQLPDKQRVAVTLRFVADSAYAEIAEVMGTSEQAARRNVHEALKRLRKELDR
jgi:RNA polymerase sigma factor (sigma-70 family)